VAPEVHRSGPGRFDPVTDLDRWRYRHGPRPRNYAEKTPKKMINLALRSALSDRAADDKVVVVDSWGFDKPSTKAAKAALAALGVEGRALVVVGRDDDADVVVRSFRNLPKVHLLAADQLNCYDVLVSDYVVFAADTVPGAGSPGVAKVIPSDTEAVASDGATDTSDEEE